MSVSFFKKRMARGVTFQNASSSALVTVEESFMVFRLVISFNLKMSYFFTDVERKLSSNPYIIPTVVIPV